MIDRQAIEVAESTCAGCGSPPDRVGDSQALLFRYPSISLALVCSARCARKAAKQKRRADRKPKPETEALKTALIALSNSAMVMATTVRSRLFVFGGMYPDMISADLEAIALQAEMLAQDADIAREALQ